MSKIFFGTMEKKRNEAKVSQNKYLKCRLITRYYTADNPIKTTLELAFWVSNKTPKSWNTKISNGTYINVLSNPTKRWFDPWHLNTMRRRMHRFIVTTKSKNCVRQKRMALCHNNMSRILSSLKHHLIRITKLKVIIFDSIKSYY